MPKKAESQFYKNKRKRFLKKILKIRHSRKKSEKSFTHDVCATAGKVLKHKINDQQYFKCSLA